MKRIAVLLSLILISFAFVPAPDACDVMVFFKEGTSTTMTSYNPDGKITGSTKTVYNKVNKTGNSVSVSATTENYDKKGKLSTTSNFNIRCEAGTLYFDMKMLMPQQQADSYKDFQMSVEGLDLEFPSVLQVGTKLKDANVKFTFKTKDGMDMPMMTMNVNISNRKIEAIETITTPAGTFECFKISEDVEMKTIIGLKTKNINWFSLQAGTVKSESYKENGKFVGKSELTELK